MKDYKAKKIINKSTCTIKPVMCVKKIGLIDFMQQFFFFFLEIVDLKVSGCLHIHADLCICIMRCHKMTTPVLPRSRQQVHYFQSFSHHLLHLIKSLTIVALNTVLPKLHLCFSAVRCHRFMRQEYILM